MSVIFTHTGPLTIDNKVANSEGRGEMDGRMQGRKEGGQDGGREGGCASFFLFLDTSLSLTQNLCVENGGVLKLKHRNGLYFECTLAKLVLPRIRKEGIAYQAVGLRVRVTT